MVNACHGAGVKVIGDAVINHMSGQDNPGAGWAGLSYSHYNYPGIYQYHDFHHCGRDYDDNIVNYRHRYEVQNCELVDLADLATESEYVRGRIAGYLDDLLSLGVDGFRLDAAKHVPAGDIAAIEAKLSRPVHIVQEFIYGAGEPIQPEEYVGNGDVHEFRYGKDLGGVFRHGKLATLANFGVAWGYLPSDKANVFIDNHDTQRGGGDVLTYNNEAFAVNGRRYHSDLPAGRYCDVIHGDYNGGACSGPVIAVDSGGWFQVDIGAHDAVAIHAGARVG